MRRAGGPQHRLTTAGRARRRLSRHLLWILDVLRAMTARASWHRFNHPLDCARRQMSRAIRSRNALSTADSRMQQCLGIPDGYEGQCLSILFGGPGTKEPLKVARRGLGHFLIQDRNAEERCNGKREDGRRRTEDGRRRTEDGGRRTEDGGRKTEDGRRRTEDGSHRRDLRHSPFKVRCSCSPFKVRPFPVQGSMFEVQGSMFVFPFKVRHSPFRVRCSRFRVRCSCSSSKTSADVRARAARAWAWQSLRVSSETTEQIELKEIIKKALHIRPRPEKVNGEVR